MTYLHVTIIRQDKFKLFVQSVRGMRLEEDDDTVYIIFTYLNGHDETIPIKRDELKDIKTDLQII